MHKQAGIVTVELNGKEKHLKFDFNAVADLEEAFGKGIAVIVNKEQMGFRTLRLFYWAGLKWKDHGLTLERVGYMLEAEINNGKDMKDLLEPIMKALKLSGLFKSDKTEDDDEGGTEANDEPKN